MHGIMVAVLGGFRLVHAGHVVEMSPGTERVLAFVALHSQPVGRLLVAGTLWSEASERRAYAALRSSLSRLDPVARRALSVDPIAVRLADGVAVDLHDARALAHRLLAPAPTLPEDDLSPAAIVALSRDLLPGWYEDWVLLESEDWRQLRLHALEALAERLTAAGRFGEAALAAVAAIRADPLRESARACLIRVYLTEGNQSEALREFKRFSHTLRAELGLAPTPQLRKLVETLL
ncbi:MAG: family transcriptional regulator, regulator of embCAB operon [Actinomycetota bacterium]|nr:family transcriptional regulator, regulator of embCAB operon [Actinomycetota bacterium]